MHDALRAGIPPEARLIDDADWRPCEAAAVAGHTGPLKRFSWLNPVILWQSRNNVLASIVGDPTENARRAWVEARRAALRAMGAPPATSEDFIVERPDLGEFSFVVLGDTGEGDVSQYAVVPAFLRLAEGSEFTLIASDVVYPAGDVNQYVSKFFVPYAAYPRPIYAVPGNHDWLDGLAGFMRHFCDAAPPGRKFAPPRHARRPRSAMFFHRLLWRRAGDLRPETLAEAEALRGKARASGPRQPNMYFCIDTPSLRIVGIDTGILGRLDADQGAWLRRVSRGPKPKLLILGKPIYSGATVSPRRILPPAGATAAGDHDDSVLGVLRDSENNFVAVVAGDVHHYERHAIELGDGRVLHSVINGAGGAFMTSTHQIPRVDLPGVDESRFVVYPTRGDSLRAYSISLLRKLRRMTPWVSGPVRGIPANEAAAIVAKRHGLTPPSPPVRVSLRSRLLAALVFPRRGWFNPVRISELLDWDDPPFFKCAMRFDVSRDRLRATAFAISGCAKDAASPVPFDGFEVELRERRPDAR